MSRVWLSLGISVIPNSVWQFEPAPSSPVRPLPLVGQKRRALHEKHRKRRQGDVGHGVMAILPAPLIKQTRADRPQRRYQAVHTELESEAPRIVKVQCSLIQSVTPQGRAPHAPRQNENCCRRSPGRRCGVLARPARRSPGACVRLRMLVQVQGRLVVIELGLARPSR